MNVTQIDHTHLARFVGDDDDLKAELFGLFTHQWEMWGRALAADTDDATWTSVCHSVKGSANAVGALQLAELCQRAEGLGGAKRASRERAVQDIEHAVAEILAEIQRWEYKRQMDALRGG